VGGTIPTLSKFLLNTTTPFLVTAWTSLLMGVLMLPYRPKQLPSRRDLGLLAAIGAIGAAAAPVLFFSGIKLSTAVNASLLTNSEVFFTALIAFSVFGERLRRRQLAEGLLIIAGIVIVSTNLELSHVEFFQGLGGNLLIVGSTFLWGIENNLSRVASQRLGSPQVAKFRGLFGGGFLFLVLLLASVPVLIAVGSVPTLLALTSAMLTTTLLFLAGLRRLGAVRTLLAFSTTSLFGSIFAFLVLGEQITPFQVIGGGLILGGVYLIQRDERTLPISPANT
jgi:drug/metabolite transporter (DMT)-like permease